MDATVKAVVDAIHASRVQVVLCVSGGASQALGWLLSAPRASRTVLEVTVPYSRASMAQLLGKAPSQFASPATAEEMALVAYNRALCLSLPIVPVVGIGFSGALASATPKAGDHRCHIAAWTQTGLWHRNLTLLKGTRDRLGEDEVASRTLIKTLAEVCGLSLELPLGLNEAQEKLRGSREPFTEIREWKHLISGLISMIKYPGSAGYEAEGRRVVLSGSFDPLHDNHRKLMEVAVSLCKGGIPCFELPVVSSDKRPLSHEEAKRRIKQFQDRGETIILTNQSLFHRKAEILPDSTFVVTVDTAIKLTDPDYYGGSRNRMLDGLLSIKTHGCDFLVAGRKGDGKLKVLGDSTIPPQVRIMFRTFLDEVF